MIRSRTPAGLLFVAVLLSGCQGDAEPGDVEQGDLPTTPRALAWLAADHFGDPGSARAETDAAEELGRGGVGAELAYDGQQLVLAVGERMPPASYDCDSRVTRSLDGCERLAEGVLMWEAEVPEEDPGVVYLVVPKSRGTVLMFSSGPSITGDPRELDLAIDVTDMVALATDARVDVTTSERAVDGGRDLDYWEGPDL